MSSIQPFKTAHFYSLSDETQCLQTCCNSSLKGSQWSCFGDKTVRLSAGSKVLIQRDKDGKFLAMVVAKPEARELTFDEAVSSVNSAQKHEYESHSIEASCDLRLGIQ